MASIVRLVRIRLAAEGVTGMECPPGEATTPCDVLSPRGQFRRGAPGTVPKQGAL